MLPGGFGFSWGGGGSGIIGGSTCWGAWESGIGTIL